MTDSLKKKIEQVFQDHKIGTLATIEDEKPFSRFMLFFSEELTLYTATNNDTQKVEQIEQHPYAHILLGLDAGKNAPYCEIAAKVSIEESEEKKQKFWNDELNKWLEGPNDPNYILLKFTPTSIRFFANSAADPEELNV